MERGYLQTDGTQMGFLPEPPQRVMIRVNFNLWTPMSGGKAFLPGLRCPDCKHIEVEYKGFDSTASKFEPVPDGTE